MSAPILFAVCCEPSEHVGHSPQPAAARVRREASGSGALAAGTVLSVRHYLPVTVDSPADYSRIPFGWPIPWTVQDHSGVFSPVSYPTTAYFVSDRAGLAIAKPPTVTDWGVFAIDGLIVRALLVALAIGTATLWRRMHRE